MEFEKTVKKRKSIRRFKAEKVEEEKLRKVLEVVRQAPSAGNLQAYKIFVVENKEKKERLAQAAFGQQFIAQSPLVLVFCACPLESGLRYGRRGERVYSLQDATIACSYAQLAVTDLGLGSCWVGAFDEEEVQKILDTDFLPIALLPIGYPAEDPRRPRKKKVAEIAKIV